MNSTSYLRQTVTISAAQTIENYLKTIKESNMISSQMLRGQGKYCSKRRSFKTFK